MCTGDNDLVSGLDAEPSEKGPISGRKMFALLEASTNLKINSTKWFIVPFQCGKLTCKLYILSYYPKRKIREKRALAPIWSELV